MHSLLSLFPDSPPVQVHANAKPFLKWAGDKSRLVPLIRACLPPARRLIEPFAGSAALWLATAYPAALIADVNDDLIRLYQTLQAEGPDFIAYCRTFFTPETNTQDVYYALRERFNTTTNSREKAALFVYLNRHCYNGLCRYNESGYFNVSFGGYRQPYFPEAEMWMFWQKAQKAQFWAADFRQVLAAAEPGDVVYCDPPYVPLTATASFTNYVAEGFGPDEHQALATWAKRLASQGIFVIVSNHATPWTKELYRSATRLALSVPRSISKDGTGRHAAAELLAIFAPKDEA